jgi:hypothetical protein
LSDKTLDYVKKEMDEAGDKPAFTHGITATLPEGTKTKQDLQFMWPTFKGFVGVPAGLDAASPGAHALHGFAAIFTRQGFIAEGTLRDIFFGFDVSGWDLDLVGRGITQLRHHGFLFYSDEYRIEMPESYFLQHPESLPWVRYTPKFMKCFSY